MNDGNNPEAQKTESSTDEKVAAESIAKLVAALHGPINSVVEVDPSGSNWKAAYCAAGVSTFTEINSSSLFASPLEAVPKTEEQVAKYDVAHHLVRSRSLTHQSALSLVVQVTNLSDMVIIGLMPRDDRSDALLPVWPSFWVHLFGARGFKLYDVLRPQLWDAPGIGWRWAQNMLVFIREDTDFAKHVKAKLDAIPATIDLVHPGALEEIRVTFSDGNRGGGASTDTWTEKSIALPKRFRKDGYVERLLYESKGWAKVAWRNPTKVRYWLDLRRIQRDKRGAKN